MRVTKGHGTENDFVLLDDRAATVDLTADLVRALADRRAGIGGDGVIRLVPAAALDEAAALRAEHPGLEWFMDYRNADGSLAEMCGNGVRVFAAFLVRLEAWDGHGDLVIGTRAGARVVRQERPGWFAVDMGPWQLPGGAEAVAAGHDAQVRVPGLDVARPALRVDVGNPHTVLAVAGLDELAAADLARTPEVSPAPLHGTNVELVVPLGEETDDDGVLVGRVRMRVHERGVGETRSCGTGACAAALAVRTWAGPGAPGTWLVDVPGGQLRVRLLESGHVELGGPAVIVADAEVELGSL